MSKSGRQKVTFLLKCVRFPAGFLPEIHCFTTRRPPWEGHGMALSAILAKTDKTAKNQCEKSSIWTVLTVLTSFDHFSLLFTFLTTFVCPGWVKCHFWTTFGPLLARIRAKTWHFWSKSGPENMKKWHFFTKMSLFHENVTFSWNSSLSRKWSLQKSTKCILLIIPGPAQYGAWPKQMYPARHSTGHDLTNVSSPVQHGAWLITILARYSTGLD